MIKVIDGDLFTTDARIIAHSVNCRGVMGSGVALQVHQKFPHVFFQYKRFCDERCSNKCYQKIYRDPR